LQFRLVVENTVGVQPWLKKSGLFFQQNYWYPVGKLENFAELVEFYAPYLVQIVKFVKLSP